MSCASSRNALPGVPLDLVFLFARGRKSVEVAVMVGVSPYVQGRRGLSLLVIDFEPTAAANGAPSAATEADAPLNAGAAVPAGWPGHHSHMTPAGLRRL
jgi:hypothetical protein